jgi:hypothetical protein
MRFAVLFAGLVASAIALDTVAVAKDSKDAATVEIAATGIKPFDEVFMQAKDIQSNLTSSKAKLQTANDNVNSSLGLAKGTPFKDALADLNKKADGKVKVLITGKTPTLTAEDGLPDNVKASVDTTNKAISEISSVVESLAQVPAQSQALADQTAAFPGQVNAKLITDSGLKVTDVPKVTKTVKSNVTIVSQTPAQAKAVSDQAVSMLDSVASTFPH